MAASKQSTSSPAAAPPPLFGRMGPPGGVPGGPKVRAKDSRATILRLMRYLGGQKMGIGVVALIVVANAGLDLLNPYLLGRAIDRGIIPRDMTMLARIAALMLLVTTTMSLLNWAQSYIMTGVSQRAVAELRNDLFAKLGALPLRFFDSRAHGDLMSRLTNDVENINQVLSGGVIQIVSGILGMVGVGLAMFLLHPQLAIISLATISSATFIANRWTARHTRDAFRAQQSTLGELNGLVEETIGGQRVVIAFHQQDATQAKFQDANVALRKAATRAQILAGLRGPMMNAINNLTLAVVAGAGGVLAVRGQASIGLITAFINYTRQFGRPLNEIANLYNSIQSALAGAERVFEIIDEKSEYEKSEYEKSEYKKVDCEKSQTDGEAGSTRAWRGEVVFEDVSFSYVAGTPILKNVHLHALPGQTIALVGPTGAGKTTIINLLTRFYEIDSGRITIDDTDIRAIPKDDLRRRLGIVLQDTVLFSGSVKDNIGYGRLDASDEEIKAAAKLANAHAFIHRLPHGYDTMLSERAGNLSQGQRQMLAIARAILADPDILILDEATSSVDTRTEQHIQEAMLHLMEGRTSFVIAHRLSTIRQADQILVIQGGRIVEKGNHQSLLAARGQYFQMVSGADPNVEENALITTNHEAPDASAMSVL